MKFGSWTYDSSKINLTAMNQAMDISTYSDSGEWQLLGNNILWKWLGVFAR